MVEYGELLRSLDVGLDEAENVSPDSLHGFDHVLVLAELDGVGNALRVKSVHLQQIMEYPLQVAEVHKTYGFCYFGVYFNDEVDGLEDFR